jgi:hypothetical protein
MAIYWHPVLAQLLRQVYGDRLEIYEEVNLGQMPLRIDLVIIRRDPTVALPYPLDPLGATTLLSYKGRRSQPIKRRCGSWKSTPCSISTNSNDPDEAI